MSVLANTKRKIADVDALIAKEKQALAEHPVAAATILLSILSLEKAKRQLKDDLNQRLDRLVELIRST